MLVARASVPLGVLVLAGVAFGQDPSCQPSTMRIGTATGVPGDEVVVDIIGSVSCDATGFSLAVGNDPDVVRFVGSAPGAFVTGHAGSDLVYDAFDSDDNGFVTIYCLFDISSPITVLPTSIPADTILGTITYEILPSAPLGETALLNRTRTFGSPNPVANVFAARPGESPIDPELTDGSILVEAEPEPPPPPVDADFFLSIVSVDEIRLLASFRISTPRTSIHALGTRLRYDPSVLSVVDGSAIEFSPSLPSAWVPQFVNVGVPGEIDFVLGDDSSSPETLDGPVVDLQVATIRFSIIGPCPDERSLAFNEDPPSDAPTAATFPVNQFLSHIEPSVNEPRIVVARPHLLGSRWTLRVFDEESSVLRAVLELDTVHDGIAAIGTRIEYDSVRLELSGLGDVTEGADAPPSWQKVYASAVPGRVDVVLSDVTAAAATIPGPVESAQLLELRFTVLDGLARPGAEAFAFSTAPAVEPAELAAFPDGANQFIEYVDARAGRVCHLPLMSTRIVETIIEPPLSVDALVCLRLPNRILDTRGVRLAVELSSDADSTTALGILWTYDPAEFSIDDDPSSVTIAPSLSSTWTLSHFDAAEPGLVEIVISANDPSTGGIPGPFESLEVAAIVLRRLGARPGADDLGFVVAGSSSSVPSGVFPFEQFVRVSCSCPEIEIAARARTCVLESTNGFVRSDCNGDRKTDISDPIWLLSYLFRGGPASPCAEACNANFDSRIDISDAIYIVNYQFQGGPPPILPFPDCDQSPFCEIDICP
jgi:hypothetical protein